MGPTRAAPRRQLIRPGDTGYAMARQLELAEFDGVGPAAVAYCAGSADVSVALRFAQDNHVPVAVRSGGHSYGGYSTTTGLIVDVSRLDTVTVGQRSVRLGPGALNVDVLTTPAPYGLVVSEGGCATVAAGGFLQGGGFGFLTRTVGMACDRLTSAEVVLADGRVVTASAAEHSDLFWAVRGGGHLRRGHVVHGHPGRRRPDGDRMATVVLAYPYDQAVEVLDGVSRWMVDAPRTIGGGAFLAQPDAAPGNPAATSVLLASTGTAAELSAEVDRLVAGAGTRLSRQDGVQTYRDLMMVVSAA